MSRYIQATVSVGVRDAPSDAVLVYGHWDSEEAIMLASQDARLRRYFRGLMPLLTGRPEVHICSVEVVVAAKKPLRRLEMQPY